MESSSSSEDPSVNPIVVATIAVTLPSAAASEAEVVVAKAAPVVAAAATEADDGFALHGFPFVAVLGAMCLGCFMAGLDWTIVVTAIPKISKEFDAFDEISWVECQASL